MEPQPDRSWQDLETASDMWTAFVREASERGVRISNVLPRDLFMVGLAAGAAKILDMVTKQDLGAIEKLVRETKHVAEDFETHRFGARPD